jgi:hypothetical protein
MLVPTVIAHGDGRKGGKEDKEKGGAVNMGYRANRVVYQENMTNDSKGQTRKGQSSAR